MSAVDLGKCPQEQVKQCPLSPCPVLGSERVARIVIFPRHVDADGKFEAQAFPVDDLLGRSGRGLSLQRIEHNKPGELRQKAERLVKKADEILRGMGVAVCGEIRSAIRDTTGQQGLCILDAAMTDDISHAQAVRSGNQTKGEIRKYREKLVELFSPIQGIT